MKNFITYLACITLFLSCKKDTAITNNCYANIVTNRNILNKQASVQFLNNEFYLIEKGTIDTKLLPCTLADDFKVNNLQVTISGEVKNTLKTGVCCTENFVISKIEK